LGVKLVVLGALDELTFIAKKLLRVFSCCFVKDCSYATPKLFFEELAMLWKVFDMLLLFRVMN